MSYTETHFAKFKIVAKTTDDVLEYIEDNKLDKYFDMETRDGKTYCTDVDTDKYEIVDYKGEMMLIEFIEHTKYNEDEGICIFRKNENNTYDLTTQFYNGGCCFQEILEEEINEKL